MEDSIATDPLLRSDREQRSSRMLASNDPLHTLIDEDENGNIDALALFFRMLEWMEIEGAILKSYDELEPQENLFLREDEHQTVDRVLEEVDRIVQQLMAQFFKEFNFACGVLNALLVTYVFAAYPQHFWFLYLIEGLYLLPRNLYDRVHAKPLNRVLSYLDYCWMMNTIALLSLICLVLHSAPIHLPVPDTARKELFVFTIGTACGPLQGAALVLPFVALLFHNLDTMTGLFIHIFPPMVAFTLRWYPQRVHEAWPGIFKLDYLEKVHYFSDVSALSIDTVAGSALAGYFLWFIPYTAWMFFVGLKLPRKDRVDENGNPIAPNYDTCFAVTMRGGGCLAIGKKFWDRSKAESLRQMEANHFEAKDLFVYMAIHAAMSLFAILVLGYSCYSNQAIHGFFLVLMAVICCFRGAKRYAYYTTTMYSRILRKHFNVLRQLKSDEKGSK